MWWARHKTLRTGLQIPFGAGRAQGVYLEQIDLLDNYTDRFSGRRATFDLAVDNADHVWLASAQWDAVSKGSQAHFQRYQRSAQVRPVAEYFPAYQTLTLRNVLLAGTSYRATFKQVPAIKPKQALTLALLSLSPAQHSYSSAAVYDAQSSQLSIPEVIVAGQFFQAGLHGYQDFSGKLVFELNYADPLN